MDLPEGTRIYVPGPDASTDCLMAVVVPTADPDESLVVEVHPFLNVHSSWGETHLTENRCLASGMHRDDAAKPHDFVREVIGRRYPEHLEWIEEPGPRAPGA